MSTHITAILDVLRANKKPMSMKQIVSFNNEADAVKVKLTEVTTTRLLRELVKTNTVKVNDWNRPFVYSLVQIKPNDNQTQAFNSETDAELLEWRRLMEVAQPIQHPWEPYVPPRAIPTRPGSDDHLQWKSFGTP